MEFLRKNITLPESVAEEIDAQAKEWNSNRSATIVRIFVEWKEMQALKVVTFKSTNEQTQLPEAA